MLQIRTRSRQRGGFHLQWYGTLGGAALGTDVSPNTSEPATSRVIVVSSVRDCAVVMGANITFPGIFKIIVADGTSITVQMWYFDATQSRWIQFPNGTSTLSYASTNSVTPGTISYYNMAGMKVFPQITANVGCTVLGMGLT